jgi:hypothetical protein
VGSGHNVLDYLSFILLAIKRAANGFPGIAVGGSPIQCELLSPERQKWCKTGPYDQSDGREHPLSAVRQWSAFHILCLDLTWSALRRVIKF